MKRAGLVVTAIIATGGVARAGDDMIFGPPGPAEPAGLLTAIGVGAPTMGLGAEWLVEAAYRPVDDVPVRVHAMFARGNGSHEDYDDPPFWHLRGGVEVAACGSQGYFCFVLDLDAGMLRAHAADYGTSGHDPNPRIDRSGLLLGGRGGFDAGNRALRFRLMVDIAKAVRGPFLVHDGFGDPLDLSSVSCLEAEVVLAF